MLIQKTLSIPNQTKSREVSVQDLLEISKTPQTAVQLERAYLINSAYKKMYNPNHKHGDEFSKTDYFKMQSFSKALVKLRNDLNSNSPAIRENIDIVKRDKKLDLDIIFSGIPFFCMETNTAYLLRDSLLTTQEDKFSAKKLQRFLEILKDSDINTQIVKSVKVISLKAGKYAIQNI